MAVSHMGVTAFLHEILALSEEASYACALVVAFCLGFFLMRHFVFRAGEGAIRRQAVLHFATTLAFRGMEYVGFLTLHTLLGLYYLLSILLVLGVSFCAKFLWYGHFVFREGATVRESPRPDTPHASGRTDTSRPASD